jgi:hypothetical protein
MTDNGPTLLRRDPDGPPYLVRAPGREGASELRVADGVAFTHELGAIEVASGMLSCG